MEEMNLLRSVLALAFVAGLVLAMGWVMRRFDMSKLTHKMQEGRRLQLREQLHLDARRKAVIMSCDDKEYLVVLGVQNETMIPLMESKGESV